MKRILITVMIIATALSSCGGNGEEFVVPEDWETYEYTPFKISVPPFLEIRTESDNYTKFTKSLGLPVDNFDIVFQQKGLSEEPYAGHADEHYMRVLINYYIDEYGTFLSAKDTECIDAYTRSLFESAVYDDMEQCHQMGFDYQIIDGPNIKWVKLCDIYTVNTRYCRVGNNGNTTHVDIYWLYNNNEATRIVISYRETEPEAWKRDMDNIIKTFKWKQIK